MVLRSLIVLFVTFNKLIIYSDALNCSKGKVFVISFFLSVLCHAAESVDRFLLLCYIMPVVSSDSDKNM